MTVRAPTISARIFRSREHPGGSDELTEMRHSSTTRIRPRGTQGWGRRRARHTKNDRSAPDSRYKAERPGTEQVLPKPGDLRDGR
jgi:hypothetical protein